MSELATETIFTWGAPPIKFGAGALDELPFDLDQLGVERVLIVTDPGVAATGIPERVRAQLLAAGLKAEVFDGVHIEPTDESFRQAVEFVRGSELDGFVAIGGGSSIDTAKAVDLMRDVGIPSGLAALGYGEEDVPGLVEGALRQQRLLAVALRPVSGDDIAKILRASMANW